MATEGLYNDWLDRLLSGEATAPDFVGGTFVLGLVHTSYAPTTGSFTTDDFWNDLSGDHLATISHTSSMVSVVVNGGIVSAANTQFTSVFADGQAKDVVLYNDEPASDATRHLIAYWPVNVTPNGGNITIQWDASGTPGRLFKLGGVDE